MQAAFDVFADMHECCEQRIGCEVGLDYRVVRHLASGGMAHVFLAEHMHHGGYAAVKFLDARSTAPTSLLSHEARMLARARHPGVVRALELGRVRGGGRYLLLEYVRGVDLAEWINLGKPRLTRERWLRLLQRLAEALDHMHACGIVHADIKPANVMFDPNAADCVKWIDFGLAFDFQCPASRITGTGTPGYMAPEQEHAGECGPASDRFAFAAVAYELLTGAALEPQISGEQRIGAVRSRFDMRALQAAHAGLAPVFVRALHDHPAARFDTARAFVSALAAVVA